MKEKKRTAKAGKTAVSPVDPSLDNGSAPLPEKNDPVDPLILSPKAKEREPPGESPDLIELPPPVDQTLMTPLGLAPLLIKKKP